MIQSMVTLSIKPSLDLPKIHGVPRVEGLSCRSGLQVRHEFTWRSGICKRQGLTAALSDHEGPTYKNPMMTLIFKPTTDK